MIAAAQAQRRARVTLGGGRQAGDLSNRPLECRCECLSAGEQPAGQTCLQRLPGGEGAAGENEVVGARGSVVCTDVAEEMVAAVK